MNGTTINELADALLAGLVFDDDVIDSDDDADDELDDDEYGGPAPRHLPSPEEIKAACAEIRRGWSKAEELRRRARPNPSVEYRPVRSHE